MCFGNRIGFKFDNSVDVSKLFEPDYGSLIIEIGNDTDIEIDGVKSLGMTIDEKKILCGNAEIDLEELYRKWKEPLDKVFPVDASDTHINTHHDTHIDTHNTHTNTHCDTQNTHVDTHTDTQTKSPQKSAKTKVAKPRVLIPVFPGTNCEYDSARAFAKAGAECDFFVMKNIKPNDIDESVKIMAGKITTSQIIMLPGGFSAGDEPDGSGIFIVAFFRNPRIKDAVTEFLNNRDGLMLGICNGFQALIKLGLVPYGEIRELDKDSPTLTFNTIGRHISRMAYTKIRSVNSPWLANVKVGDVHTVPISHGEGRLVASSQQLDALFSSGQVATQYVNCDGNAENGMNGNCNGSFRAIEGLLSPDGRVFGKMGHSERAGKWAARNIYGDKEQGIFAAGVDYFR
jgi:phosphoribosylformylglycinamidine synthase